jgi:hypothetical protein
LLFSNSAHCKRSHHLPRYFSDLSVVTGMELLCHQTEEWRGGGSDESVLSRMDFSAFRCDLVAGGEDASLI